MRTTKKVVTFFETLVSEEVCFEKMNLAFVFHFLIVNYLILFSVMVFFVVLMEDYNRYQLDYSFHYSKNVSLLVKIKKYIK